MRVSKPVKFNKLTDEEERVMVHFDPTTGSLLLPIWVAATLAALLVALAVMAVVRSGAS